MFQKSPRQRPKVRPLFDRLLCRSSAKPTVQIGNFCSAAAVATFECLEPRVLLAADPIGRDDFFSTNEDTSIHIGSLGSTVGYQFTGSVIGPNVAFGSFIPFNAPVTGQFFYDTSSDATHSGTSTGYRQQRAAGFTATIGGLTITASDYVAFVANDLQQSNGPDQDQFSIQFNSSLNPPPHFPIDVNGSEFDTGLVQLNFAGPNNLYSDESLPTDLNIGDFFDTFSFVSDQPNGAVVLFQITSLQEIDVSTVGVLANDEDPDTDPLTVVEVNGQASDVGQLIQLPSGANLTIQADGSFEYDPNGQFSGLNVGESFTDSYTYTISDGAGGTSQATANVVIEGVTPPIEVVATTHNSSSVDIVFSGQLDEAALNLYDGLDSPIELSDVALTGQNVGEVSGSLIWNASSQTLTFTKTGGVLVPDTYTLSLASRSGGFVDLFGQPLDGDSDGQPGEDFVTTFEVVADDSVVVSIPDFARGPGQDVDLDPDSPEVVLPVYVSDGIGVLAIDLTIEYDPTLLTLNPQQAVRIGRDVPNMDDGQGVFLSDAVANTSVPGVITIAGYSFEVLLPGQQEILQLVASVPSDAPLGAAETIRITELVVSNIDGAIPSRPDDAVHAVAYPGDVTGSSTFSALDASSIARVAVGMDTGFDFFPRIDPALVGDVTQNGVLTAFDAAFVARKAVGLDQDEIPNIPVIMPLLPPPLSQDSLDGSTAFASPTAYISSLPLGQYSGDSSVTGKQSSASMASLTTPLSESLGVSQKADLLPGLSRSDELLGRDEVAADDSTAQTASLDARDDLLARTLDWRVLARS
ncbi:MAG: cadherin-like domain-containing protein [Planctomycetales bacterium]|nr:cadherin-like domain-containing protein [Planctomycetales bacterium]